MDESELRSIPLFEGLDKKDRRVVAQRADLIDIPEGKQLAREGEFAYEFFVIRDGTAEVTHDGETLAELGPGDFFGEMGVLSAERRNATVTAKSEMTLVVLTDSALRALDREQPEIGERLRKAVEERQAASS
jgi:CRP/FNR family transcriptional regulator, cyclic AMP receptor protein